MEEYVICSALHCDFSYKKNDMPPTMICPKCGKDVITNCPHCSDPLYFENQVHCINKDCRQRLIPKKKAGRVT